MGLLQQNIETYIIHKYDSLDKNGRLIEVAVYSLDEKDIKFRIIKFINNGFKEIHTTENKEEALALFDKLFK